MMRARKNRRFFPEDGGKKINTLSKTYVFPKKIAERIMWGPKHVNTTVKEKKSYEKRFFLYQFIAMFLKTMRTNKIYCLSGFTGDIIVARPATGKGLQGT